MLRLNSFFLFLFPFFHPIYYLRTSVSRSNEWSSHRLAALVARKSRLGCLLCIRRGLIAVQLLPLLLVDDGFAYRREGSELKWGGGTAKLYACEANCN